MNLLRQHPYLSFLAILWFSLLLVLPSTVNLVTEFGSFGLLGVIGAIFANATGAGGGVVFVPFFNQLGFEPESIIGTSFAIQCCGMTAGAITWWRYGQSHHAADYNWAPLTRVIICTLPASFAGIWSVQYVAPQFSFYPYISQAIEHLHLGFGVFSILLALAIFGSLLFIDKQQFNQSLSKADVVALPIVAFFGGIITAWLSVGVGELVAVYLIIRGFNVTMSIAAAVILSAFSVWSAIAYHALIIESVQWAVVLFAGAGAIAGGIVAKRVVLAFSPKHLKMFFAAWVLILGVSGLPIFSV